MTDDLALSPSVVTLTRELVEREPTDPPSAELAGWLAASPRFRRFAEANRSKIRKKLRNAADPEAALDVRAELQVARLLLSDARFEVAFEAYGSRVVGPDFTVTDRAGRAFNLEVTRVRRAVDPGAVAAIVLGKLRQLPPSTPNGLVLAVDGERAGAVDVDAAIRSVPRMPARRLVRPRPARVPPIRAWRGRATRRAPFGPAAPADQPNHLGANPLNGGERTRLTGAPVGRPCTGRVCHVVHLLQRRRNAHGVDARELQCRDSHTPGRY
jgi:hypothetical protein